MRLVFLGTPDFALPALRALAGSRHEVVLVLTRPDRPRGRGKKREAPPVRLLARELGLRVEQPAKVSTPEGIDIIRSAKPEAGVVCAYGEIISADVLDIAPEGFFNVHASLLPKFRGAAPVQHAILSGASVTGVTIIRLVEKMDAGDVIGVQETPIESADTAGTLTERLAELGARALIDSLDRVEDGTVLFERQNESEATYAPKITKKDARIDWERSADYLERFVRAMWPVPGAFTIFERDKRKLRLIIERAVVTEGSGKPGTVIASSDGRLVVAAGQPAAENSPRALELLQVQPEGKRMMSASEFLRGYAVAPGSVLE